MKLYLLLLISLLLLAIPGEAKINIVTFPAPVLDIELGVGGELEIGKDYYFYTWYMYGGGYYGCVSGPVSNQFMITPTLGNQTVLLKSWQEGGSVSSYADAGGGEVTVTIPQDHTFQIGDNVTIKESEYYNGSHTVSGAGISSFDIVHSWDGDETTSLWRWNLSIPTFASGVVVKWDYFNMTNLTTGEPFKWLNYNDPEYASILPVSYGHKRWGTNNYVIGYTDNVNRGDWYFDSVGSGSDDHSLKNASSGSSYIGSYHLQLDVSHRDDYYVIPNGFLIDKGMLGVVIDDTNTNNDFNDLKDALTGSKLTDQYRMMGRFGTPGTSRGIEILGGMIWQSGTPETTWKDGIYISYHGVVAKYMEGITFQNMILLYNPLASFRTTHSFAGNYIDTRAYFTGSSFDIDNIGTTDNFVPYTEPSQITSYVSVEGIKFIKTDGEFSQIIRYMNRHPERYIKDCEFLGTYPLITYRYDAVSTMSINNTIINTKGLATKDAHTGFSYFTGIDVDYTFDCIDVTIIGRDDNKIRVYRTNTANPTSINETWNMQYSFNLKILDSDGEPIEGAGVSLVNTDGLTKTDISDINGSAVVIGLSYINEYDALDADGYGLLSNTSDFKTQTLTISKKGYNNYIWIGNVTSKQTWEIILDKGGEKMDAVIFGVLALAFFLFSVLISLSKNEKGDVNIFLVYIFQIAGILMARSGLRVSAEMALVDYNIIVAGIFNTGAGLLTFVLYGYLAFIVIQLIVSFSESMQDATK